MSRFRSYFLKNATLIENNYSNNSQNPVTEISYGTFDKNVSRYIFDVDLNQIKNRINEGAINPNNITKHYLCLTNTIKYSPQYIGKNSYTSAIKRASSFNLELFNISENWDEGSGYDFEYYEKELPTFPVIEQQAVNWYERKNNVEWFNVGVYDSGSTQIISSQRFEKGNENIKIDITDYINQRLSLTGLTGTTVTGDSFGLGIKFTDDFERLETEIRQAVAFHAKNTNTFYEPYIETIIDDPIMDDRNYFYLNKINYLYLYINTSNLIKTVNISHVNIYDYQDNLIDVLSGNTIIEVNKGVYKLQYFVDSNEYPDGVLFKDQWIGTINGREFNHTGDFYLIPENNYLNFDNLNQINLDNYHFNFYGISHNEKLKGNNIRKIKLSIKELYPNQNNFIPLDIKYRIFTVIGNNYELDIIPITNVNRKNSGYEFNLDTSWLIPQDYYLQIILSDGFYYKTKETLRFTITSDGKMN